MAERLLEFEMQNYGCLLDVRLKLTPLHALIGPNDSGKSTVLRAIETLYAAARGLLVPHEALTLKTRMRGSGRSPSGQAWSFEPEWIQGQVNRVEQSVFSSRNALHLGSTFLVRLSPDALRAPSGLIPDGHPIRFADSRGAGLPGIYDAILNRGDDAFYRIAAQVRQLFPTVKNLRLKTASEQTKLLEIELLNGKRVDAAQMSEGLLYYLAFAVLPYIDLGDLSVLLIEEPENGLHPARIAEIMRMLRQLTESNGLQIILATHSPLVINELKPDEVTLVTRHPQHGTRLTPMTETRNFAERAKVYALGELWLSYANGMDEEELVGVEPVP